MPTPHTYVVTLEEQPDGPDAALRERWATCAVRRLGKLEVLEGAYPEAGGELDILDNGGGPFVWEMSEEQFEADPPSAVYLEVVSVDPAEPAEPPSTVTVVLRVPF